jgi:hypothetical protein
MKYYKYSIELFIKDDSNGETIEAEFNKALEIPKKLFNHEDHLFSLRYSESEREEAIDHCILLNKELQRIGYLNVEFRIKENKIT